MVIDVGERQGWEAYEALQLASGPTFPALLWLCAYTTELL